MKLINRHQLEVDIIDIGISFDIVIYSGNMLASDELTHILCERFGYHKYSTFMKGVDTIIVISYKEIIFILTLIIGFILISIYV